MNLPVRVLGLCPFLPAHDFLLSQQFYKELGGEVQYEDSDIAVFILGQATFILQNRYEREWAENTVLQLWVEDIQGWYAHVSKLGLAGYYSVRAPTQPKRQPWGAMVSYLFDPAGVVWEVMQMRAEGSKSCNP